MTRFTKECCNGPENELHRNVDLEEMVIELSRTSTGNVLAGSAPSVCPLSERVGKTSAPRPLGRGGGALKR
eukprot:6208873-Pleurochrysis_carterae.AAC.11